MVRDSLDRYRRKRDFRRTTEPSGDGRRRKAEPERDEAFFVIQKHDASSLHYDFRLAADGVLKSWAVRKGPSTDPREKRLAVQVEDHPLDYADFEGVIRQGEYGAGPVIVWDRGSYENQTRHDGNEVPLAQAIEDGHVSVWLDGDKLTGGYALTRFRGRDQWLLVKQRDGQADARRRPTSSKPGSVLTGRTIEDVWDAEG